MANKQFNPTSEKRFEDCSEEEKEALYDYLNKRQGHADWNKKLEKIKKQPDKKIPKIIITAFILLRYFV